MTAKRNPQKAKGSNAGVSANVSVLKTHLGQYLKKVKQGIEVIVYDRQLPVAKLIPFNGDPIQLIEVQPTISWAEVQRALVDNVKKRPAMGLKRDSLYYLGEDRGSR